MRASIFIESIHLDIHLSCSHCFYYLINTFSWKSIIIIVLSFFLTGCISEFSPVISNDKGFIIIDARLSDKEGAVVKLSKINKGETRNYPWDVKANIEITDNFGEKIVLTQRSSGVYWSDQNGIPGHSYILSVKTSEGKEYVTSPEVLYPVQSIDSVYGVFELHTTLNSKIKKPGIAFYVEFNTEENLCQYLRWTWDETWVEKVPYEWRYFGKYNESGDLVSIETWPLEEDSTGHNRKCYYYNSSNQIAIESTAQFKPWFSEKKLLLFVDDLPGRLSAGYSIEIQQHSLTYNAFLYYKQLQQYNELSGSLYDPIPSSIESNIHDTDNPMQKITGYFVVSSITRKRIFIKPGDIIPDQYRMPDTTIVCTDSITGKYAVASRIHRYSSNVDIYDIIPQDSTVDRPLEIRMTNKLCFDCTEKGGSTKKPQYWNDYYSK